MVRLWGFQLSMGDENEHYFSNSRGKGFKTRNTCRDKDVNAMGCNAGEGGEKKAIGIKRKRERNKKISTVISALRRNNRVSLEILKR